MIRSMRELKGGTALLTCPTRNCLVPNHPVLHGVAEGSALREHAIMFEFTA